jgi:DNA-binding beta-propeller fold protein YncE
MDRRQFLFAAAATPFALARPAGGTPVALVTAETDSDLLAVSLANARILRRVHLPADPENVDVHPAGPAVVVSSRAGAVTILAWRSLRIVGTLRGFENPHIAEISPDGKWAYVTDDGSGLLSVIQLTRARVVHRVLVGAGAHHMAWSADGRSVWVALGERARTIVVLDASRPSRPRVVATFDPGFGAHDLGFSPDGRGVWLTSDDGTAVVVVDAASRRRVFTVDVGPPPQHVAFGPRGFAYVTSGYGSRIVMANERGRILRTAATPYGSFNLTTAGGLVVTSSLLRGTLTELDDRLQLRRTSRVASATRDVGLTFW